MEESSVVLERSFDELMGLGTMLYQSGKGGFSMRRSRSDERYST